ncbi:MAG: hypothetical protein NC405_05285 [Odoribacter sp.]|nr:hypothetical protein [Odoribacter sp.]
MRKRKIGVLRPQLYVGWHDGSNHFVGNYLPYPNVEDIVIADDWSNFAYVNFSLRINNC